MYLFIIETFLASSLFVIKMAAIKTVGFILHSDIEQIQETSQLKLARKSRAEIFENIMSSQSVQYNGAEIDIDVESDDTESNEIAGYLQLFSTVFCVNFILRKPIMLEMSKLMLRYKISETTAIMMFNKILTFLKCDAPSLMDTNSLIHLLSQWINIGLKLDS